MRQAAKTPHEMVEAAKKPLANPPFDSRSPTMVAMVPARYNIVTQSRSGLIGNPRSARMCPVPSDGATNLNAP